MANDSELMNLSERKLIVLKAMQKLTQYFPDLKIDLSDKGVEFWLGELGDLTQSDFEKGVKKLCEIPEIKWGFNFLYFIRAFGKGIRPTEVVL